MKRARGVTLLEALVSSVVLLLLTTALFASWAMTSQSWSSMFHSASRLSAVQVTMRQLQSRLQDASQTCVYQLSPLTPALAFTSAWGTLASGSSSSYGYQSNGFNPLWQKYGVYYLDAALYNLDYREIPISATDPVATTAVGIDQWNGPYGVRGLGYYCAAGQPVAQLIDTFSLTRNAQLLTVTLSCMPPPNAPAAAGNGRVIVTQTLMLHN